MHSPWAAPIRPPAAHRPACPLILLSCSPAGPCHVNETLKGLWEFPMWDVQGADGAVLTNMDPQARG